MTSSSAAPPNDALPPRLLWYVVTVIAATVPVAVGAALTAAAAPPARDALAGVLVFALAALAAEFKPVPLDEGGARRVSLAFVFLLAAQILFGWQYAVIAALVATAIVEYSERGLSLRGAFNTSAYALAAFASALPAFLLGWNGGAIASDDAAKLTILAFAGGATYVVTNVALVAVAVALATGTSLRSAPRGYLRDSGPAFLIMAFISALAVSLWKVDPPLELLLAGPVFALALYLRSSYRTVLAVRDAETDGLTSLGNHRSFQIDLRRELEEAAAGDGLMSLALIDLDGFKDINDRFGHPVGDSVLRLVARVLREQCGEGRAYRIGGEEFAALLPGHTSWAADTVFDRVHERLAATEFPHGEPVTVSVGLAVFPDDGEQPDQLMQLADQALYRAKSQGRNRLCFAGAD